MLKSDVNKALTKVHAVIIAVVIIIASAIGIFYYYTYPPPSAVPQVLTFATSEDIDNLDPHYTVKNCEMRLTYLIYDGLLHYGRDPARLEPSLAVSWEVSDDGLRYTFRLREGVVFEDGTPFNASVVKFSFERLLGIGAGPASPFEALDRVEVMDTYVVRFVLKEPFAPFLSTLASNFARIVPPSVKKYEADGDWGQKWLSDHSLGSGPFKIESFIRGDRVVLVRNEKYWGPKPRLEKVIVRIIPEPATLRMELEAGTIDIAEGITMEDIDRLKQNPNIQVFESAGIATTFLFFNTQKPPFNESRVRRAIAYAIDYNEIINGPMKGYAKQIHGPIPEGMWGRPDLQLYSRNITKALSLLAEAGYPNGFSTTFTIAAIGVWPDIAVLIQRHLADIGITVNIRQLDWTRYVDMIFAGEVEFGIIGITPDYSDPDMWAWFLCHSKSALNLAFWHNETVDSLLDQSRRLLRVEDRAPLYKQVQTIVHEEAIYIYLFQSTFLLPMRTWVKGYYYNICMEPRIPFNDMWIEK